MSEHMLEWLPAYHDGELSENRRRQVEANLESCPSCRAELQDLQGLSVLLKTDPAPAHTPPERFGAQVQLLLPRRTAPRRKLTGMPGWMLGAPLLLIVAWAFLQAALLVTAFAFAAAPLFPGFGSFLAGDSSLDITGTLFVLSLGLLGGAGILWAGWMALWWTWKQNYHLDPIFNRLEKEV